MELRDEMLAIVNEYMSASDRAWHYDTEAVDRILSIPKIKEALAFHESCKSALEHGDFYVTKENFTGVGGVSAS